MPLFSIVLPAFNSGDLIDQTILSLLNQLYTDFEIIIVDDGSNDGTIDRLQKYKDRVEIFKQNHAGPVKARNLGIRHARGEYIVSFDHDDILLPHSLIVYHHIIEYFKKPAIIMAKMQYFSDNNSVNFSLWDGRNIQCSKFNCFFKKNSSRGYSNSSIIIKKDLLLKNGGYLENSNGLDDNTMLMRLGVESPFITIDYPITVAYRTHTSNFSKNVEQMVNSSFVLIREERLKNLPGGKQYKLDRRGLIGSTLLAVMKNYLGLKNFDKIISIILSARSMLLLGIIRKFASIFYISEEHIIKINEK